MATRTTLKVRHHRFTVDDYYRMAEVGILHEEDRVELIEGEIIEMPPIGDRHAWTVGRLDALLQRQLGDGAMIWVQNPLRLSDVSDLQPDLCVFRPRSDLYFASRPEPTDVLFLIEVAETSLSYDRSTKLQLYARAKIPEVWIVDLGAGAVEVYRNPREDAYSERTIVARGSNVSAQALNSVRLSVTDIVGPQPSN